MSVGNKPGAGIEQVDFITPCLVAKWALVHSILRFQPVPWPLSSSKDSHNGSCLAHLTMLYVPIRMLGGDGEI
eukprot:7200253-Karenia_brevis.AAC.1